MSRPSARPLFKPARSAAVGSGAVGSFDLGFDLSTPDEELQSSSQSTRQKQRNSNAAAPMKTPTKPTRTNDTNALPPAINVVSPPPRAGDNARSSHSKSSTNLRGDQFPHADLPTSSRHFALTPNCVEFNGVEEENVYFMLLNLQNISLRRRTIKILPPLTDQFSMELSTVHTEISPGLNLKLKIYFKPTPAPTQLPTDSDEEFVEKKKAYAALSWHDRLVVISGEDAVNDRFVIPLHAYGKRPSIVFNSFLNFGTINNNANAAQSLSIKNEGTFAGTWKLEFDKDVPLNVQPREGTLMAGEEVSVRCDLTTMELPLGAFRTLGRLTVNESNTPFLIDVSANLVEANLQLIWPTLPGLTPTAGNPLSLAQQIEKVSEVYFGSVYFGEVRKIDAILLNNTPSSINFLVNLADSNDKSAVGGSGGFDTSRSTSGGGGSGVSLSSGDMSSRPHVLGSVLGDSDLESHGGANGGGHSNGDGHGSSDSPATYFRPDVLVSPMEGRLEAYGSMKLTFVFQPLQPRHLKKAMATGFKNQIHGPEVDRTEPPFVKYAAICKVDTLDGKYRTTCPIVGLANIPCASLSSDLFDFGSCPVHEHVDQFLTVKNVSSSLPLYYAFSKAAQFGSTPSEGLLQPRESRRILLTFKPNNLGVFKNRNMDLNLIGSTKKSPVTSMNKAQPHYGVKPIDSSHLVSYPILLSGCSETIGLNRTLQLTTGGASKVGGAASTAKVGSLTSFKRDLNLKPSVESKQAESELHALATGTADITLDSDGDVVDFGFSSTTVLPARGSKKPFKRITGWNDPELASKYSGRYEVQDDSLDARVTFTPKELHARTQNQEYYRSFLKNARQTREAGLPQPVELEEETPSDRPRDERNMGLGGFGAGLSEPTIPLPAPAEKLKLHYSMGGFEGEGRKRMVKGPTDAANGVGQAKKKQLKTAPSTRAEKRDCEAQLSPEELQMIIRVPKMIEFGKLCRNGIGRQDFTVTNDLEQCILIELKIHCPELSTTTPTSLLIPPGEVGVFPIVFKSSNVQEFKKNLIYTINGQHDCNIMTTAFVVPMELQVNKEELNFEFRSDNSNFYVSEYLTLENVYNVPIEFFFSTPSGIDSFQVLPNKGIVPSHEKLKVEIRYEPKYSNDKNPQQPSSLLTSELTLQILEGLTKKVILRAMCPESSLTFHRGIRSLDFGSMCVGTPISKFVTLRNDGVSRTVFRFEDLPAGCKVKPLQGKIETGTTVQVQVTVYPTQDMKLKHSLLVNVRGKSKDAKPLRLLLKGEAQLPQLSILEDEISFGGVTLGSTASKLISLHNTGLVPSSVYVDLTRCQEFGLTYSDALGNEDVMPNGQIRNPIIQRISTATIKKNGSTASLEQAELTAARGDLYRVDDDDLAGYSIFLAPKSVVAFQLTFTPTRVVEHAFELPFTVAGIPAYPHLRRVVTASGLKPRISLSTQVLDFGKRVLLKKGRALKNPYVAKFTLKNEDSAPVSWVSQAEQQAPQTPHSGFGTPSPYAGESRIASRLGTASPIPDATQEVNWRTEPTSGTLAPGQEVQVMCFFAPTAAMPYSYPIDIFIQSPNGGALNESLKDQPQIMTLNGGANPTGLASVGEANSSSSSELVKPYTSILLTGTGTTPRLIFDVEEVLLPVVPLGIKSSSTFHIRNEGYENLELKYEVSMDATRAPITIRLPEGSTLGTAHPVLPVEVLFIAKKPVSFTLMCYFFDAEGNKFGIRITGTSDNSICTVQNYIESHPGRFEINVTNPPISEKAPITSASNPTPNKVFTLVETIGGRASKIPGDRREHKAIYSSLADISRSNLRRGPTGFDFDDAASDPDPDGTAHGDGDGHIDESMLAGLDFNTPGSISRTIDDEQRLTPVKMLGLQGSLQGGESLFAHTLDSLLAYLNASKLLAGGFMDEELNDSPPGSPPHAHAAPAHEMPSAPGSVRSAKAIGLGTLKKSVDRLAISAATFPADLIRTQGKIVRTLIRNLSGKVVPTQATKKANQFGRDKEKTLILLTPAVPAATTNSLVSRRASALGSTGRASELGSTHEFLPPNTSSNKSDDLIWTIFLDYEDLLIFLKSQGCLLGPIQPWHLLSWNQLLRLLAAPNGQFNDLGHTATMTPNEIQARQRKLEKDFPSLSRMAWLQILIQIVKVFILARITPQQFKALPGMSPELTCMSYSYSQSNIYSVSESILLEWLSYHYNRSNPLHPRTIVDFQKSLIDGLVLAGVIASHVPALQSLQHMRTHIISTEDCVYNAGKVILALKEVGLAYQISSSQLVNAHQRDMIFFVLFLYQKLPSYVPKTTLEFKGALADDIVKCIELSNPSNRPITYSVHLDGSSDFKVDKYSLKLAPKGKAGSTAKFPVRFRARFSKPVEARLVFNSTDESGSSSTTAASTLVFLLKSHITSRNPVASYQSQARVYETQLIEVRVTNMFASDCTFNLAVKIDLEPPPMSSNNKLNGKPDAAGGASGLSSLEQLNNRVSVGRVGSARSVSSTRTNGGLVSEKLPPPIFVPYERIKLRAGESAIMQVHFLPFRIGAYHAQMIFLDELCGEFMIDFTGTGLPPPPSELFKWTTHLKTSEAKELQFGYKNPGLDLARSSTFDRIRALSRQQRDLKKNKSDWHSQILRADLLPPGSAAYQVHSTSPFFQVPSSMTLYDIKLDKDLVKKVPQAKSKQGSLQMTVTDLSNTKTTEKRTNPGGITSITQNYLASKAQSDNKLSVLFTPRGAGVYRGELVLTSIYDSRVFALEVTVLADETNPLLEYHVPSRQSVTQDIPLTNSSPDVWTVKSVLTGKGFTCPADVTVFPGTTGTFPLTFAPNWVCDVQGSLVLTNSKTDERFVYDLHGIGDEPLAESHITITAPARSTVQHTLPVTNAANTDIYYTVECDIPSFQGSTNFRIGAGETSDYVFTLSPQVSGTVFGSLTFHQADKKFQWFALELQVTAPAAESDVFVTTPCRKASSVSLDVTNPLDQPVTLEVAIEGPGLFGPKTLALDAKETKKYEFIHSPLLPSGEFEASVSFAADEVGEFWYRILCTATAPEPEPLDFGEVEVGTFKGIEVVLENPTDEEIALKAVATNTRNFAAKPNAFNIPPLSSTTVTLRYTPSSIDGAAQSSLISFSHPIVGDWLFPCAGVGVKPSAMPLTLLTSPVGSKKSHTIAFRNPFDTKIKVDIELVEDQTLIDGEPAPDAFGTFQLFMKRTHGLTLQPFTILQVPFLFCPELISSHTGTIRIHAGELGLTWSYPLQGIAEGETSDHPWSCKTIARANKPEQQFFVKDLKLHGPTGVIDPERLDQFKVDIECEDIKLAKRLHKSVLAELVPPVATTAPDSVRMQVQIAARVPFKAHAFLVLSAVSGGRWKFPLVIEVGLPIPDDTIRIEAAVNATSSVAFRLKNFRPEAQPFTANLSNGSSACFHVYPRSGVFPPAGDDEDGTQFVVSFSPQEYGKPLLGDLEIYVGDDTFYLYSLIGSHAKYSPPSVESTIDTRLDPAILRLAESSPRRRNIVATNVLAAAKTPLMAKKVTTARAWRGTGNTSSAAISAAATGGFAPPPNNK